MNEEQNSSCNSLYFQKEASLILHDVFCSECNRLDQKVVKHKSEMIYTRKTYNLRKTKSVPDFHNKKMTRIKRKLKTFYQSPSNELSNKTVIKINEYLQEDLPKSFNKNYLTTNFSKNITLNLGNDSNFKKEYFFSLLNLISLESKTLLSSAESDNFIIQKNAISFTNINNDYNLEILENFDITSNFCQACIQNYPHKNEDVNLFNDYCNWGSGDKCSPVSWPCTYKQSHSYTTWSHSYKFTKREINKFLKGLQSRKSLHFNTFKIPVVKLNRVLENISNNVFFICLNDLLTTFNDRPENNITTVLLSSANLNSFVDASSSLCITPPVTPISD